MNIPKGMEAMVFSYAYYEIGDFELIAGLFNNLEKEGLFVIEKHKPRDKEMSGAFIVITQKIIGILLQVLVEQSKLWGVLKLRTTS